MHKKTGFTVVELLIVIVVIAILAALVTVAYNGIRKNAVVSTMKDSLQSIATKMKTENIQTETYPTTLPSISTPAGIGFALAVVPTNREFCINATAKNDASIQWHTTQNGTLQEGLCSGAVIVASIIGDYYEAPPAQTVVGVAQGSGGGLVVTANQTWSAVTISWTAVANASRYEVQLKPNGSNDWYLRRIAAASNQANAPLGGSYESDPLFSAHIPNSSTSISWTGTNVIAQTAGEQFQYRYRSYDASGVAGAWHTATLNVPEASSVPMIPAFSGTPASNWASVNLAWTTPTNSVPEARIEIQLRNINDAAWSLRRIADTSANPNAPLGQSYDTDAAFSARIPTATQTLNWKAPYGSPQSEGQTYEYRIRLVSSVINGLIGPWRTIQVSTPSASEYTSVNSLTAVAAGTGSSSTLTLNWSQPTPPMPGLEYEIQLRNMSDGVWYLRRIADSSSNPNAPLGQSYDTDAAFSARIPSTTTSLVWDGVNPTPQAGQTFEYRIRQKSTYITNLVSNWYTVQVVR